MEKITKVITPIEAKGNSQANDVAIDAIIEYFNEQVSLRRFGIMSGPKKFVINVHKFYNLNGKGVLLRVVEKLREAGWTAELDESYSPGNGPYFAISFFAEGFTPQTVEYNTPY